MGYWKVHAYNRQGAKRLPLTEKLGGSANTRSNIIPALREVQYPGSHASGKAFYLNLYIYTRSFEEMQC